MGSQREGEGEGIEVPVHLPQSRTHVCSGSLPFWGYSATRDDGESTNQSLANGMYPRSYLDEYPEYPEYSRVLPSTFFYSFLSPFPPFNDIGAAAAAASSLFNDSSCCGLSTELCSQHDNNNNNNRNEQQQAE